MTLLSFTSAVKYVLGLMLVMLGLIPYDAIESNKQTGQNQEYDTIFTEQVQTNEKPVAISFNYQCEFRKVELPVINTGTSCTETDSLCYLVIDGEMDSLNRKNPFVVIINR